jgi:hypothetical protein
MSETFTKTLTIDQDNYTVLQLMLIEPSRFNDSETVYDVVLSVLNVRNGEVNSMNQRISIKDIESLWMMQWDCKRTYEARQKQMAEERTQAKEEVTSVQAD